MLLHLVRHAEADRANGAHGGGVDPDPSLSPTGIRQAGLLPAALGESPDAAGEVVLHRVNWTPPPVGALHRGR